MSELTWCGRCRLCLEGMVDHSTGLPMLTIRMVACPDCGNKRCPRAADHRHTCSGSNEPGRPGSASEMRPEPTRPEEGLAATLQRISNAARVFADEFDLIPESQLYGRITSGEIQTACTNAADTLTRLQRERDAARALVEDMQTRIAELTEDVRALKADNALLLASADADSMLISQLCKEIAEERQRVIDIYNGDAP